MFSIEIEKQALKFLKKLRDDNLRIRLIDKINELGQNPFPRDCKIIEGYGNKVYRIRVSDYRILYYVVFEMQTVYVFIIDKRGSVYK